MAAGHCSHLPGVGWGGAGSARAHLSIQSTVHTLAASCREAWASGAPRWSIWHRLRPSFSILSAASFISPEKSRKVLPAPAGTPSGTSLLGPSLLDGNSRDSFVSRSLADVAEVSAREDPPGAAWLLRASHWGHPSGAGAQSDSRGKLCPRRPPLHPVTAGSPGWGGGAALPEASCVTLAGDAAAHCSVS